MTIIHYIIDAQEVLFTEHMFKPRMNNMFKKYKTSFYNFIKSTLIY